MSNGPEEIPGVIAPPPLIYVIPLAFGLLLHRIWRVRALPGGLARLLGLALLAPGLAIMRAGLLELRRAGTDVDPRRPVTALVTTGPYRFSRNPLYLALTLVYAGITLLANTLWAVLLLPPLLIVMRRGVIDREECYLAGRFGQEYRDYRARVRRWF